jgi:hypothetical protein
MEEASFSETWVNPRTFEYSASFHFMGVTHLLVNWVAFCEPACYFSFAHFQFSFKSLSLSPPITNTHTHTPRLDRCKIRGSEVASVLLAIFMHLVPCGYHLTRKAVDIFSNFLSNSSFLESCIRTWWAECRSTGKCLQLSWVLPAALFA